MTREWLVPTGATWQSLRTIGIFTSVTWFLIGFGSTSSAQNLDALQTSAENHASAGESAACVSDYTRLLAAEPTLVRAFSGRAACYAAEGNMAAAMQDYSEGIRLSPI